MTQLGSNVRLLLGSTNRRKIREWRLMLDQIAVELVDPHQQGLAVDATETGETPEENAPIKPGTWSSSTFREPAIRESPVGTAGPVIGRHPKRTWVAMHITRPDPMCETGCEAFGTLDSNPRKI